MAGSDTANTKQHYVPQMLLRGFVRAENPNQVWVFDKKTGRNFPSAIENIGAERGYYDIDGSAELDAAMNCADDLAAPIIARIRERRSIAGLSLDGRILLAEFVILQFLRTRGYQEQTRSLWQSLAEAITQRNRDVRPEWVEEPSPDELRRQYLRLIPQLTGDFLPHLLDKNLMLYRANPATPFHISDHPVAMDNTMNPSDGMRGTLGFGVTGIEIYMPISSELILAQMCPSIGAHMEAVADHFWLLGGFISEIASGYISARNYGTGWRLTAENVRYYNSLQARNAERFVISSINAFADIEEMVMRDPDTKIGRRVTVV
jgi:hypothetical protein